MPQTIITKTNYKPNKSISSESIAKISTEQMFS